MLKVYQFRMNLIFESTTYPTCVMYSFSYLSKFWDLEYNAIRTLNCILMYNNIMYSSWAYKVLLPCKVLTIIFFLFIFRWLNYIFSLLPSLLSQIQARVWVLKRNSSDLAFIYIHIHCYIHFMSTFLTKCWFSFSI